MWSRGTAGAATIGAIAVALLPQPSGAADPPRQTYRDQFTTDVPGAVTGRVYAIDYLNPQDPGGKPHAFSHLHLELAPGARFDTSALPYCEATDAELIARGPDACPPETRVGTDETVLDTGFPGPGRFLTVDFAFFNNKDELILLPTVRENGARVVVRGKIGENTLDIENPMVPGTPPDGGAAKSQRGRFQPAAVVRAGRQANYLTTPPTCPAGGFWVNRIVYTYRDGVEEAAESRSPCRRPDGGPGDADRPVVSAFGIPKPCASRRFRAHFRIADASRLRSAEVLLDGRRVAGSRHKRLSARVAVADLRPGRHGLTVMATDSAGNTGARTFRFRVCAR